MHTPEELTRELAGELGESLKAVILYGSAAAGDLTRKNSDVNLLVVVARADAPLLARVAPLVARWTSRRNRAPLIVAESQFRRAQDVFPIEFSDIRERHKVLHGDAALVAAIEINPANLRHQLEFELRSKLLLLRQAYLETYGRSSAAQEVMARSLSSLSALLRGVLRLVGERVPASTPEILRRLNDHVRIDSEAWETVWRLRVDGRLPRGQSAEAIFSRLLAGVEALVEFVDAHHAS